MNPTCGFFSQIIFKKEEEAEKHNALANIYKRKRINGCNLKCGQVDVAPSYNNCNINQAEMKALDGHKRGNPKPLGIPTLRKLEDKLLW